MNHYTKQVEQYNDIVNDDSDAAVNRYAIRLSHQRGFSVDHIRAALVANAAVKEN
jgi:hypothetical protein